VGWLRVGRCDIDLVYGVATVSRIDKIICFFCRISSLLYGLFAEETYNFIDPANRSHPIVDCRRFEHQSTPCSGDGRAKMLWGVAMYICMFPCCRKYVQVDINTDIYIHIYIYIYINMYIYIYVYTCM